MNRFAACLVLVASVAFSLGLILPMFTVRPSAGDLTALVQIFPGDMMRPKTVSLLDGMTVLWHENEQFLAVLLTLLSVVLPVLKLSVLWLNALNIHEIDLWLVKVVRSVSKYAMAEVFVLALLVMIVKSLPGGSRVTLHAGAWAYTASVMISIAAGSMVRVLPKGSLTNNKI